MTSYEIFTLFFTFFSSLGKLNKIRDLFHSISLKKFNTKRFSKSKTHQQEKKHKTILNLFLILLSSKQFFFFKEVNNICNLFHSISLKNSIILHQKISHLLKTTAPHTNIFSKSKTHQPSRKKKTLNNLMFPNVQILESDKLESSPKNQLNSVNLTTISLSESDAQSDEDTR